MIKIPDVKDLDPVNENTLEYHSFKLRSTITIAIATLRYFDTSQSYHNHNWGYISSIFLQLPTMQRFFDSPQP